MKKNGWKLKEKKIKYFFCDQIAIKKTMTKIGGLKASLAFNKNLLTLVHQIWFEYQHIKPGFGTK